ncbi:MAG: hypothetical protein M0Z42_12300 [Actinomycetota bacterium]|nr:hypothetical protein [Actinomycetota bacterium]
MSAAHGDVDAVVSTATTVPASTASVLTTVPWRDLINSASPLRGVGQH